MPFLVRPTMVVTGSSVLRRPVPGMFADVPMSTDHTAFAQAQTARFTGIVMHAHSRTPRRGHHRRRVTRWRSLVPHSYVRRVLAGLRRCSRGAESCLRPSSESSVLRTVDGRTLELDVRRWMAPADQVDESLLDRAIGPVLDVGCGPGRHVSSLLSRGIEAMGIDTSPTAVRFARRRGARVAHQSIFDAVPDTGQWRCGLLLDGSIGIGGDPESLLQRVSEVLSERGRLLVETVHPQQPSEDLDVRIETAASSGPWFRWSLVSHVDMAALAAHQRLSSQRRLGGRWPLLRPTRAHRRSLTTMKVTGGRSAGRAAVGRR